MKDLPRAGERMYWHPVRLPTLVSAENSSGWWWWGGGILLLFHLGSVVCHGLYAELEVQISSHQTAEFLPQTLSCFMKSSQEFFIGHERRTVPPLPPRGNAAISRDRDQDRDRARARARVRPRVRAPRPERSKAVPGA